MTKRFKSAFRDKHVEIRLIEKPLLGREQIIPPERWLDLPNELRQAARLVLEAIDSGQATPKDGHVYLSNPVAADLPAVAATALGFPEKAAVRAKLRFSATIGSPEAICSLDWQDQNFRAIAPSRSGIVLTWGERSGRLGGALFDIVEAVGAFNASMGRTLDDRVALWADVRSALQRLDPVIAEVDDYSRNLEIMQAGSFALDVDDNPQRIDFRPVLMSRHVARSQEDDAPSSDVDSYSDEGGSGGDTFEDLVDAETSALLVREDQSQFIRAFGAEASTRRAYNLRRNTYLLIDEDLRSALDVVKQMRTASEDEKRDFIRNPRSRIAAALGRDGGDALVGALFIETKQYSDRVTGLGVWERPNLPWLTRGKTDWLPENFPVTAGGQSFSVSPSERDELAAKIAAAESAGSDAVTFQGSDIPLAQAAEIVRQVDEGVAACAERDSDEDEPPPLGVEQVETERLVVQIKTNFEAVDYHMTLKRRRPVLPDAMPAERISTSTLPHQKDGYQWLVDSWKEGWPGVLLADDMGLGKTFQALAFLAWLRANREQAEAGRTRSFEKTPVLIVAPTALLRNWVDEAEKHLTRDALGDRADLFGGGLKRFKVDDPDRWPADERLDIKRLRDCDWILTTYETLADNHRSFSKIRYSVVLFDEMQKIKDPGTINTHAAKSMNADFVIGLTGTPIENRIEDLWSLMDRIAPGYLGDLRTFSSTHSEPNDDIYQALKHKLTKPVATAPAVMLRRMKEEILDGLPNKTIFPAPCNMPPEQARLYEETVAEARSAETRKRGPGAILKTIQRLRGISLYPDDPERAELNSRRDIEHWINRSARLKETIRILSSIDARDEKALVFIEHRKMQRHFAHAVAQWFDLDRLPTIINGETPGSRRKDLVDEFQKRRTGFDLMILSPKAAGVGLTITEANHVIHLSRWWNPAVEDQCNDRVYRLGQTRPVEIHIPMAIHPTYADKSFDAKLDFLLEKKRLLSRTLLMPPVGANDVAEMFDQTIG